MTADHPPTPSSADRLRRRGLRIAALSMIFALALLGVGAWLLAESQSEDRERNRERFATGAVVASALIDSLFQVAFSSGVERAATRFSGEVTTAQVDEFAELNQSVYVIIFDAKGKVVAASSKAPRGAGMGLLAKRNKAGIAIGDVEDAGSEEVVESVITFPVGKTSRAILSAAPVKVYRDFLTGSIQPLVRYGGAAYVLDGGGNTLGAVDAENPKQPRPPDDSLAGLARDEEDGFYDDTDHGEHYFAAQPIRNTDWHVAVTVATEELYTTSGASRWLPWVILAVLALAMLAIGMLIRRAVNAGAQLAVVNSQLEASQGRLRDRAVELQSSNAELQRSNAELEQFAYVASHDLSAPLRAVAGFSQLLGVRYKGKLDDDADQFITHMQDGVERMQRIIDDLLAYSRVDRSGLQPERIDLDAILDEVLQSLRPDIEERGALVTRDRLGGAVGEPGQLSQVMQNLIANGLKFTAEGVRPEVHVSATRGHGRVIVSVRDNGIGVDPGQSEQIFKMFQRLHSTEEYEGTGIGLAIAKKIVDRHGGRIEIGRAPGGGAIFSFDIPAEMPR